jgi:hypothetical protein
MAMTSGVRQGSTMLAALGLMASLGCSPTKPGTSAPPAGSADRAAEGSLTSLRERVEARRRVLDRQELTRAELVSRLEFAPIGIRPERSLPFPRFCFFPAPTAAAAIDPHRSLFVHDRVTLDAANFSLNRTLSQIAAQVVPMVPGTTALGIFKQLWDTQNVPPGVTNGPHCDGTLNGFPINCPRSEGVEASGSDAQIQARLDNDYKVLALVNRLDLAHQGWRNCGEHRIVYGKRGGGVAKNLIIFEAVLPNPRPGCREGCVAVAEFWKSLSTIDDPAVRAQRLEQFYYTGLPGFRPVVHVNHYSANGVSTTYGSSGSGQIRTNQFLQFPWLLKEFKTVIDCGASPCRFEIVPTSVKVNPHGTLWNADNPDPRAVDFQADTAAQTAQLGSGSLTGIGYSVDLANNAGQSDSLSGGPSDHYRNQLNSAVSPAFRTALITGALTSDQMANRALTQSCAGCHQPSTFGLQLGNSIGPVSTPVGSPAPPTVDSWPGVVSAGFVHVDVFPPSVRPELAANPAAFGAGLGQEISVALLNFFLPERRNFLLTQLNAARCACINRFRFLDAERLRRALEVEARVQKQFDPRLEPLDVRIGQLQATPGADRELAAVTQDKAQVLAERDKVLIDELGRNGITLPESESLDLKPQALKLKAAAASNGDPARERALRIEEVGEILKQEPPRRTVTGSFRVH